MIDMADAEFSLPEVNFQTPQHEQVLNIIDSLRSLGIGRYIDLPQIIVCGDQSSGKSSALEAISGLRFPTKDNLCTRFATELILRRGPKTNVTVTIIPRPDCPAQSSNVYREFKPSSKSIDDFPKIVAEAEKVMGLNGSNKVFSMDVLRVELSSPSQPHLTLVDLPGIFWAGDNSQSDDDAALVRSLVESYMKKTRSIILAVISAKSDLAMQVITKLAREIDPKGHRTMGIITKPDLLHATSDSETAFVKLAKNEIIQFKLGWHVLKNRDYDTRHNTRRQRDESEEEFFKNRVWSSALRKTQLGVTNLRPRLSRVLLDQILAVFPALFQEVESELQACKDRLDALGEPRGTLDEQRLYLLKSSQTFAQLMKAAVDGFYDHDFFGCPETAEGYRKRLRAVVQYAMSEFSETMAIKGQALRIVDELVPGPYEEEWINRNEYLARVTEKIYRNRGRELPGLFNPSIVGDLFFEQAKPWPNIVKETAEMLVDAAKTTIDLVLDRAADPTTKEGILLYIVQPNMDPICDKLYAKVEEVLKPHTHGHPLTFNDSFTQNLQRKRQEELRKSMLVKIKTFFNVDPASSKRGYVTQEFHSKSLLDSLVPDTEQDMGKLAAIDATNAMEAYYQVRSSKAVGVWLYPHFILTRPSYS